MRFKLLVYFLVTCGLSPVARSASPVVISEFMANGSKLLVDEDNDSSDWIELHNQSTGSVSLDGWWLTDTLDLSHRWRLPATNIVANGYLVIFASGKDRAVPG